MLICIDFSSISDKFDNDCVCGDTECDSFDCYDYISIYGSWNDWTSPLDPESCLWIDHCFMYNIPTDKTPVSFKLKSMLHDKYILMNELLTVNDNGFINE